MKNMIFFDTVGGTGHNWFYNHAIISGLLERNITPVYISFIKDPKKVEVLKKQGIAFENLCSPETMQGNGKGGPADKQDIARAIKKMYKEKVLYKNSGLYCIYKEACFIRDLLLKGGELKLLERIFERIRQGDISRFHFLTMDFVIYEIFVLCLRKIFFPRSLESICFTATLHWAPNTWLKKKIVKLSLECNLISKIAVHGEYIRESLVGTVGEKYGERIKSIMYPMLPPSVKGREECKKVLKAGDRKGPYLLCFGATRYDKGVDILIDALAMVAEEYTLIIAGKAEDFTEEYLRKRTCEKGIADRVWLNMGYVEDQLIPYYFSLADIIVLPYRSDFTGQSGPLTEGINYKKIVIAPDRNNLGYTIRKYNVGEGFQCNHAESLARTITYCLQNMEMLRKKYLPGQEMFKEETGIQLFQAEYCAFLSTELQNREVDKKVPGEAGL